MIELDRREVNAVNTSSLSDDLFGALANFRNAVAAAKKSEDPNERFDALAAATEKALLEYADKIVYFLKTQN